MDYGALIREAWVITRRYRFLWVFGLFAGGAVGVWISGGGGNGPQHGMGPQDLGGFGPQAEHEAAQVAAWIIEHLALILGAAAVLMVLGLALVVLALIAQGAMAAATAEVASGQPSSFRTLGGSVCTCSGATLDCGCRWQGLRLSWRRSSRRSRRLASGLRRW